MDDAYDPFSDDPPPSPSETVLPDYVTVASVPHLTLPSASRPPSYAPPTRPTQPITYTFVSWSTNTMLLMPPQTSADLSPVANIGVTLNLNPFAPLSYVTTVRRGGTPDGAVIGEFELAIAHNRATVKMAGRWKRLAKVLTALAERRWRWDLDGVKLWWDCSAKLDDGSPMCICLDAERSQVASFVPPPVDASPPLPDATLTVFPMGHEYLDHIVVSALILERKITLSF